MLTCGEITDIISDYLDGQLPLMQRFRFQMHVGVCRRCRAYLRQMKAALRTLSETGKEVVPPAMPGELLKWLRDWRRYPPRLVRSSRRSATEPPSRRL